MASAESSCVLLRRLWAGAWDAARFAAGRPLRRPAFALEACAAQLELAARAVVRLRLAIGADAEVLDVLPLEGCSLALLEQLLEGGRGAPGPVAEPAGFVRALVHASFQTGDGGYGLGLGGAAALDGLIDQRCADLLSAARALHDPEVATRDLERASVELAHAVESLLSRDLQRLGQGAALALSGRAMQLGREMRQLASQVREASAFEAPEDDEPEPRAGDSASGDSDDSEAEGGAAPATPEPGSPRSAASLGGGPEERAPPPARSASQAIKRIKVEEVADEVEARRGPVQRLRRVLSRMDLPEAPPAGPSAQSRYERAAEDLKQVQRLQKCFHDFGEDLMDGMLTLDQLSGLAEDDRRARGETIRGIQGLLEEIDSAKPRVAKMQRRLASELQELGPEAAVARGGHGGKGAPEAPPKPAPAPAPPQPSVDWARLRLPLQFSSVEAPGAYVLAASARGLEPGSLRLSREAEGVLRVRGARLPSAAGQRALLQALAEHMQRLPRRQRRRLTPADVEEMLLQLGHGRFGSFAQDFEIPRDVDWAAIAPSYEGGVLRVVLPRRAPAIAPTGHERLGGWPRGAPTGLRAGPGGLLW